MRDGHKALRRERVSLKPFRQCREQQRGDDGGNRGERAVDRLPAEMRCNQRHQRQAAGNGDGPSEKYESDRARPFMTRGDQRNRRSGLRGVDRTDRQHSDPQQQDHAIV